MTAFADNISAIPGAQTDNFYFANGLNLTNYALFD